MKKIAILTDQHKTGEWLAEHLVQRSDIQLMIVREETSEQISQALETFQPMILISIDPIPDKTYPIVKLCARLKIHYIDFSVHRDYVTNISQWDPLAKEQQVIVISGAGMVPGLSSVIIEKYAEKFKVLREIDFGIAFEKSYQNAPAGNPFQRLEKGEWKIAHSGQNVHRYYYGDSMGLRWHADADTPDLTLFPQRYPKLQSVMFYSGVDAVFLPLILKFKLFHKRTYVMDLLAKIEKWIMKSKKSSCGMYIHLYGTNQEYQPLEVNWKLISEEGQGKHLSIIGGLILIDKIIANQIEAGAKPCMALYSVEEFEKKIEEEKWKIYTFVEEVTF